jgi:hypothetical protein
MCFSAEASLGVAVVLLPVGGYCAAAAAHKDRAYLPLAAVPLLFGVQQLCEAGVWLGLGRGDPDLTRLASRWFLFFAVVFWPCWVPLAAAAVEPGGTRRRVFLALAGLGLVLGCIYYLPLAAGGWADARVVGHSIRYDFSAVPVVREAPGWVWPALYLIAVCGPLVTSGDRSLRPLGVAVAASTAVAYLAFREAFASVWCFLAAALSAYIAYALYRLPDPPPGSSAAGGKATSVLPDPRPLTS